jgi:hypothetical protein
VSKTQKPVQRYTLDAAVDSLRDRGASNADVRDAAQAVMDHTMRRFRAALTGGDTTALIWSWVTAMARYPKWSFGNIVLLWAQGAQGDVKTKSAWEAEGYHVDPAQLKRPYRIWKPIIRLARADDAANTEREETEAETERRAHTRGRSFVLVPVYSQSQLVEAATYRSPLDPVGFDAAAIETFRPLWERLRAFLHDEGFELVFAPLGAGSFGALSLRSRRITLNEQHDLGQWILTVSHEWAHHRLHVVHGQLASRATDGTGVLLTEHDREVEAEAVAAVVRMRYGIPLAESGAYLLLHQASSEGLKPRLKRILTVALEIISVLEGWTARAVLPESAAYVEQLAA